VTSGDLENLNHRGIQELKVDLSQPRDKAAINENNLPGLSTLSISIKGFKSVMQSNRPFRLKPHTKLREVTIDHMFFDECSFETLNHGHFPQLVLVRLCEDSCFLTGLNSVNLKNTFDNLGITLEFLKTAEKTGGKLSLERNIGNFL